MGRVVSIQDMNPQSLAWFGIDYSSRDTSIGHWLVDVVGNQRTHVRHRVSRVEVLAVNQRIEPAQSDLAVLHATVLVAHVTSAIQVVMTHFILRRYWVVAEDSF